MERDEVEELNRCRIRKLGMKKMVVTGCLFIETKNNEERLNEDEECQVWLLKQE